MEGYTYRIIKGQCSISFHNSIEQKGWQDRDSYNHYSILNEVFDFMRKRGFEIGMDPKTKEQFPSIAKDYFYGRKGDLEFKANRYPTGFEIQFFQNVVFENRNGGEYDFDKFRKMPYLIRLSYINESNRIMEYLKSKGFSDVSKVEYTLAEDSIKQDYVESWHKSQVDMNFKLSDLDGPSGQPSYNTCDRDKKEILNGQVKYFRDYDGRLMRTKVYHNINNMWWCITSDTEYTNKASFHLFDATEEDFKNRRVVKDVRPRFQYAVITSQYGYSYHSYICRMDLKNYLDNAKGLARELIVYRAGDGRKVEDDDLGDLTYHKNKTIRSSYNVNAQGDIYFRNVNTLDEARKIVEHMNEQAKDSRKTFRRKGMSEDIRKYHNDKKIEAMVSKYFEIVEN